MGVANFLFYQSHHKEALIAVVVLRRVDQYAPSF